MVMYYIELHMLVPPFVNSPFHVVTPFQNSYLHVGETGETRTRQPVEPRRRSRLEMMEATWCVNAQNVGLRIQCS